MNNHKSYCFLFLLTLFICAATNAVGQAPNISYNTPQTYTTNTTITALPAKNTGGVVPPNAYGQVSTFAGTGMAGTANGNGTAASFSAPLGLAFDAAGNIYVGDYNNNLVRKISPAGVVTTLSGVVGMHGAINGAGTNATFALPDGVAVDKNGNVYVADSFNDVIRKITPDGTTSTLAGSPGLIGSADGAAGGARFNMPTGVAVDNAGNIYVTDGGNNLIRTITPGGFVTTIAGNTSPGSADGQGAAASFNNPQGLAVDASGNIYVADALNNKIRKVTPAGLVTTVAGTGAAGYIDSPAAIAQFNFPYGIAIDQAGTLYVVDEKNNVVRTISTGGVVATLAGNGSSGTANGIKSNATFSYPGSIVADGKGNVYVGDVSTFLIRKVTITGYTIDKPLPAGLTFDGTNGTISGTPTAASPATDYTVTAYNNFGSSSTVVNITVKNNAVASLPPNITYQTPQTYYVKTPVTALAPINTGGAVPATVYGEVSTYFDGTVGNTLKAPEGLVMDVAGNIFVVDQNDNAIKKISAQGAISLVAGGTQGSADGTAAAASFFAPYGIAQDGIGNLYIADQANDFIRKVTPGGVVTLIAGLRSVSQSSQGSADGPALSATFNAPVNLTFDAAGNLFITDLYNNRIRKLSTTGIVSTFAGSTQGNQDGTGTAARFFNTNGLTFDASGTLYVADQANHQIRKITPGGVVTTFAGSGAMGSADGTGKAASFSSPSSFYIDGIGNLFVADGYNYLVRKITSAGVVTTIAGTGSVGSTNGVGKAASFSFLGGITGDGNGNLFLTDRENNLIRKVVVTGYMIDKPLPPGLVFDAKTGIISGTPTATSPATNYTVTAYNVAGSSSTVVNIGVKSNAVPLPAPPNIKYQTPNTYTVATTITPLTPNNTGGAVPGNAYGLVTTFAGSGSQGSGNGASTGASFNSPVGVTLDASGNLFVTEFGNNDIREITPAGTVTTFAGGSMGANNGQGTAASFSSPFGLTTDGGGNFYIADEGNQQIREITPGGAVTTFAGSGVQASIDGSAAGADFSNPFSVVFDAAGNLYVADKGNSRIRKIDITGQVSTFAILDPSSDPDENADTDFGYLAIDAAGNLYVPYSDQLDKIAPDGTVTALAGIGFAGDADGTGTNARFNMIEGITIDGLGNFYIAEAGNNKIREVTPAGVVTTIAGSGTAGSANGIGTAASFSAPYGDVVDPSGNFLYVADSGNQLIRKVAITGWKIDKPLPAGLTFDYTTGIISGTPEVTSPATDYVITAYNSGGSSSFTVNIKVVDAQTVVFNPIPPKTVCDPDFDPEATGKGPITYSSSNPAVATVVAGKIHITGAGTTILTAADTISHAIDTLTVTPALVPSVTISPVSQNDCKGMAVTYTATPVNGGTNPAYQWQVNGVNAGTDSTNFTSIFNNNDKITCILASSDSCVTSAKVTSNTATFVIDPPVTTSVSIVSTVTGAICAGTPVSFIATPVTPDTNPGYQWRINSKDAGENSPLFTSTALADGDVVTCIMTNVGKCLVNPSDTSNGVTIQLSPVDVCTIVIPNTITPNGDGINDVWNITSIVNYPNVTVKIFNRYGQLVYNSIGYPKPWDGTYNGSPLAVGTYYYIIDPKNGKKPLAGPITIIR